MMARPCCPKSSWHDMVPEPPPLPDDPSVEDLERQLAAVNRYAERQLRLLVALRLDLIGRA